ncbi:MAG: methyltransferase domain-containing protein [Jatrophihabitantaceae bacterium]
MGGTDSTEGYLLDNARPEAGERFAAFAELFDLATFAHIQALGIRSGWHCWEVGAGSAAVPTWLADHVGATGQVLATDLDLSWLAADAPFQTRVHDVGADPAPDRLFDLVHARLVLVHVPARDQALATMVSALEPGGWLFVEDADPALQPLLCLDEFGPEQELANRIRRGFRTLMAGRGADLAFGRTLPRRLRDAGLIDIRADAYFPVTSPACAVLEAATVRQIRDQLVQADLATDAEIDLHLANVASGRLDLSTAPMICAAGRKPLA